MGKYMIWNGVDTVYTLGKPYKFTPDEWKAKYPWTDITPAVISGEGAINGAFCMPFTDMVNQYAKQGCDFSVCTTDQEKLDVIEAFEEEKAAQVKASAAEKAETEAINAEMTATSLASIAASMEYQNMMTLDDVEEDVEVAETETTAEETVVEEA